VIRDNTPGDSGQSSPSPAPHPSEVPTTGADSGSSDSGSAPEGSTTNGSGTTEAPDNGADGETEPGTDPNHSNDTNDGIVSGP